MSVKIQGSDDDTCLVVEEKVARMSKTIGNMLDDVGNSDTPCYFPNIRRYILVKIFDYCKHVTENPNMTKEELEKYETSYIEIEKLVLCELVLAVQYLDIPQLLELTCKTMALLIQAKMPDEIRETFGITTPFTPEQEEFILQQNLWCEEIL